MATEQNMKTTIELLSDQDTADITTDITDTKYDDKSKYVDYTAEVKGVLRDLFYIYNDHAITGPHEPREILKLYMTAKIQDIVWFKSYVKEDWVKVDLSDKEKNEDFEEKLPVLHKYLMPRIKCPVEKFEVPVSIPIEAEKGMSARKRFMQVLGILLMFICAFVVGVHTIPTICVACCCYFPFFLCIKAFDIDEDHVIMVGRACVYFAAFGFVATPPSIVYFVLLDIVDLDEWNSEIQSWMISYIAWGLFSYLSFVAVTYGLMRENENKFIQHVMAAVFWILGVDFGNVSAVTLMRKGQDYFGVGCILLFPSIASLLPSAIIGFIANFVLEEKFVLKCNEGFANEGTNLCSQDGSGCCQVISSHDIWNVQDFVGGLASNILATWAIIRICGYLLVNASSEASVWAKRAK